MPPAKYYKENSESCKAHSQKYRDNNKDKINEKHKVYRENNKDKIKEARKVYRENNKDKIKEQRKIKIICSCGMYLNKISHKRHLTSKQHNNILSFRHEVCSRKIYNFIVHKLKNRKQIEI